MTKFFLLISTLAAVPMAGMELNSLAARRLGATPDPVHMPQESAQTPGPKSSLEARLAWPRPPFSSGVRALGDELASAWEAAGCSVKVQRVPLELSLPTRGSLRVLDAQGQELRRRAFSWDPKQVPTRAWPSVGIGAGAVYGEAAGPVLDVGDGSLAALERIRAARLEIRGSVALCQCSLDAAGQQVLELAAAGCVAVLFELPEPLQRARAVALDWPVIEGPAGTEGTEPDPRAPVPVFVVHRSEAEALREQLVVRRMEGEDGRRRPFRVGPGPLQAELSVDAEAVPCSASSLWVRPAAPQPLRVLYAATLDRLGPPVGTFAGPAGAGANALRLLLPAQRNLAPDEGLVFFDGSAYGAASLGPVVSIYQAQFNGLEAFIEMQPERGALVGVHSNESALRDLFPELDGEPVIVLDGPPTPDR